MSKRRGNGLEDDGSIRTPTTISGPIETITPDVHKIGVISVSNSPSGPEAFQHRLKMGIAIAVTIGLLLIVLFSLWFCCGGRQIWKRKKEREGRRGSDLLPLHNSVTAGSQVSQQQGEMGREVGHDIREVGHDMREVGAEAPPKYEEAVPVQHQRLAGGMAHERAEVADGVVADGKMPLSEMPFEDVVVGDHTMSQEGSSSASRRFMAVHHNGMGDTSGHTNS